MTETQQPTIYTHPTDRRIELRVKIKCLAVEARIIRLEEKRLPGASFKRAHLHQHRVEMVRQHARAAQLAYAFLRGRTYSATEPTPKAISAIYGVSLLKKIRKDVTNFGGDESGVSNWLAGK
jgi:hypothetical protein